MPKYFLILFLTFTCKISVGQHFLNGSFENNLITDTLGHFDLKNHTYDSLMSNSWAFGTHIGVGGGLNGGMSILRYYSPCGSAQNGNWYVVVRNNNPTYSIADSMSLKLSSLLLAGHGYTISFYDRGCSNVYVPVPIIIGVSNDSNQFGNLIYTAPIPVKNAGWYKRTFSFIAPINALYITVATASGSPIAGMTNIDNFKIDTCIINLDLGNDTIICQGASLTLNATKANSTYLWQNNSTDSIFTVTQAGTYWVSVTNICGTKTDTINITTVTPTPLNLSDTIFCNAGNYVLNAYNNAYNKYLWNTSDTTPSITITNAGRYIVTASNATCKVTDTVNVQIFNFPQLKITDTSFCTGGSIILNAGNINYTKYLWNLPTGQAGIKDTNSFITVKDSGNYIVTASNGACSTTDTAHVSIVNLPPINLVHDTTICDGNTLTLNASNVKYTNYLWNTGATTPQISIVSAGKYSVTASNGTCTIKDSTTVKLYPLPHLNLPKDTIVCLSQLGAVILNAGKFKTYYWYPTGEHTQIIAAVNPEIYMVVVTDSNNCIGSDTTLVDDNCPYQLYMPNVFTPTSDLLNETFKGYGMGIAQFEMHIYNRWGEELFSTTDINKGWDGTFKNNTCMADSYVWQVTYRLKNESTLRTDKGTVTLLK